MFEKLIEAVVVIVIALAVLPCLISIVAHTVGPIVITMAVIAACLGAFRALERRHGGTRQHRGSAGAERKPIMPHEEN